MPFSADMTISLNASWQPPEHRSVPVRRKRSQPSFGHARRRRYL